MLVMEHRDQLMIEAFRNLAEELVGTWVKEQDAEEIGCDHHKVNVMLHLVTLGRQLNLSEEDLPEKVNDTFREVFLRDVWGTDYKHR